MKYEIHHACRFALRLITASSSDRITITITNFRRLIKWWKIIRHYATAFQRVIKGTMWRQSIDRR